MNAMCIYERHQHGTQNSEHEATRFEGERHCQYARSKRTLHHVNQRTDGSK